MESDLLLRNIRSFISITEHEWQFIASLVSERHFRKKEFITREGEVARFTNIIESGSARAYYIDSNGQEHVIQLGIKGWWISDFASFTNQAPGLLYVEALEPTWVSSISYEHLQAIFEQVPAFERFYRLLIQKAYASFQNRVLENLSLDAEQRYLLFRQRYPDMDAVLPQKHVASYLGISAEFLSKIKKRLHEAQRKKNRTTMSF